ncbi:MAG: exodeoxyribonuclease VII small subunit [Anaerolineales bacterium]|nr:MAG: exodeoxyribonuclease VII small subunit [Anaerolineales bacterium]
MTQTTPTYQFNEAPVDALPYEQAFAELEQIVMALEIGEHTLDEGLNLYQRGQALARHCADLLEKAELRVQQLVGGALEDFEGE